MKKSINILFLLLSNLIFGQNQLSYLGTLILDNNTPISFGLEIIEDNGIVNGYSITNIGLKDETKSEVSGIYFKKNKSFQLQENQIISTNSEAPINSFCYINMTISYKGLYKKKLEGTFIGNYIDSNQCASGKIILMEKKKLEKKLNKFKRYQKKNMKHLYQKQKYYKEMIISISHGKAKKLSY